MAYESGTTTGSFGGMGMDTSGDMGGFGGVTTSQTLLAQRVAPPQPPGSKLGGLVLLIAGGLGVLVGPAYYQDTDIKTKWPWVLVGIAGATALLAGIYLVFVEHRRLAKAYDRELDSWAQQWVCKRCGARFAPR
ncbi:MAG TPA: hypothetical protein VL527_15190 [Dongiaceae bacterium]|jgi:hypothetical protein|nr:hypothetical protein [Dongiaceae bacterium]